MDLSANLVLIASIALTSYLAWQRPGMMERWMFIPKKISQTKQCDRFVLSGMIHKDATHLFFNLFTLYFFGGIIERFFLYQFGSSLGILGFLGFFFGAVVVADIPTYFKHKEYASYRALGASGGVAATVFASILLMPLSDICLFGIFCLPGFALGALFLIYSIVQSKRGNDGINHDAHLFGALFGIVAVLILAPHTAVDFVEQIKNFRLF